MTRCSPRSKPKPPSTKQVALLHLLASGLQAKQIAALERLNLSTVNRRIWFLRDKYEAVNTTHLVAKCLREGVIA